jgi:hypothetical protein
MGRSPGHSEIERDPARVKRDGKFHKKRNDADYRDTSIDLRDEDIRIVDRLSSVLPPPEVINEEPFDADASAELTISVMIEFIDEKHVGPYPLDDLGDVADLGIVGCPKVAEQLTLGGSVEGGIEGREPDGVRRLGEILR